MGDLNDLFLLFDRNRDGGIDASEFQYVCSKLRLGLSSASITALFKFFDRDDNGLIQYDEFKKAMDLPSDTQGVRKSIIRGIPTRSRSFAGFRRLLTRSRSLAAS